MSTNEINELLVAIGRSPTMFRRDTPQLLLMLDNVATFNRRVKNVGRNPERRIEGVK